MSGPEKTTTLLGEALTEALRKVVREEIYAAFASGHQPDRLLTAEQASTLLSVSPDWLYRHARQLPFSRKLGPKMLRFSLQGIQKYLAARKAS